MNAWLLLNTLLCHGVLRFYGERLHDLFVPRRISQNHCSVELGVLDGIDLFSKGLLAAVGYGTQWDGGLRHLDSTVFVVHTYLGSLDRAGRRRNCY